MAATNEPSPTVDRADDPVFALHLGGKMEIASTVSVNGPDELSMAYTPGVARVCEAIAAEPALADDYTWVPNTVAVVTDGTAVLGLGDIGPVAAMPVMEGKAVLFKQFAGVDAVPICLGTKDVDEIVDTVARLAPSFGGVNLEDISAPRCFEIEQRLKELLDIPVFHDDQHGTAIVCLGALQNALSITGRDIGKARVVISGAGAAGVAVTRILLAAGVTDLVVTDRRGVLHSGRDDLTPVKQSVARVTADRTGRTGDLAEALVGADVYLGVSGGVVPEEVVARMAPAVHHLRAREPDPRGAPGRRAPARPGGGDRPLGLPEPDQQRARVPRGLPRCVRRSCHRHHRGHEARRRERPGRPGRRRPQRGLHRAVAVRPRVGPAVSEAVASAARPDGVARR